MLKAIVDDLKDVDDKYHDLYEERGGKFHLKRIEGLVTQADVDRLQTSLNNERSDHTKLKDRIKFLKNMNLDEVEEQLKEYPVLKAKAGEEGDLEERAEKLAEARIKQATAPLERKIGELEESNAGLAQQNESLVQRDRKRKIGDSVRKAATDLKMLPSAIEDALVLGDIHLNVDDNGNIITNENSPTEGVDPKTWLTDMQKVRPHWWPESEGGGAGGGGGRRGFANNPYSHDNWNRTEQAKIEKEDMDHARSMAKAAGTEVGGLRPEPKDK